MQRKATLAAIVTTVLWSGSYIVNKFAFAAGIGPLTLSGIRYTLAALTLLALLRGNARGETASGAAALSWRKAAGIGCVTYVVGQGLQYVGQSLMNPTMVSMIINAGMILFILVIDKIQLHETGGKLIYAQVAVLAIGVLVYYNPWNLELSEISVLGTALTIAASLGAALNVTINRHMLKNRHTDFRQLTTRPMLCGGLMLLLAGLAVEKLPPFSWQLVLSAAYLIFISGALGFSMWVWSQQHISAVRSGSINSAMLIEIALLDVIILNRKLLAIQWVGIVVVFVAIVWLQRDRALRSCSDSESVSA